LASTVILDCPQAFVHDLGERLAHLRFASEKALERAHAEKQELAFGDRGNSGGALAVLE